MSKGTAYRTFVSYIDKSREYYLNKGFGNPYRWASNAEVPFTSLSKPLAQSRLGVITTAALDEAGGKVRVVYNAPTVPGPAGLHTHHLFWHKTETHTDDRESYLPLDHLGQLVAEGSLGTVSPRFYGAPTKYSQRQTNDETAPAILKYCQEDKVDVALLIPL